MSTLRANNLESLETGLSESVDSLIGDRVIRVTSIAAMKAYSVPAGYVFSLNDGGRSGTFDVIAGDFSAELAADTENGIYIGLADDPTATTKVAKRRITDRIYLAWFGVNDGDNINTAYSAARALCILEKRDLQLPAGDFLGTALTLIPGQRIYGYGQEATSVDGEEGGTLFGSPTVVATDLTQTTDLLSGELTHTINNTCEAGDFIRFSSTKRFTEEWDGGVAMRSYYNEGEILQIKSATSTEITFYDAPILNFPLSTYDNVEFFTPHKRGGIFNLKVKKSEAVATYGAGIRIDGFDGFDWDGIYTENYDEAGLALYRSFRVNGGTLYAKGGGDSLGLDYGLSINDGCKFTTVDKVVGTHCRHAIAAGGTGYANCMIAYVNTIVATDCLSHGADTHANTYGFHYENIYSENGFSMAGRMHSVGTAICNGGGLNIQYSGGTDFKADKIIARGISVFNANEIAHRMNINVLDIETSDSPTSGSFLKGGSTHINIKNFRVVNPFVATATSVAEADSFSSTEWEFGILWTCADSHIENAEVAGFHVGFYLNAPRCTVKSLSVTDCAWSDGVASDPAAILVSKNAQSSAILWGNVRAINTNLGTTGGNNNYRGRVLEATGNGTLDGAGLVLTNINTKGTVKEHYYGFYIQADYTELFLQNNRIDRGSGGDDVLGTGKFIFNTVVADN